MPSLHCGFPTVVSPLDNIIFAGYSNTMTRGNHIFDSIRAELDAIARGDHRSWIQISSLLQAVDGEGYWQQESASSFTEWMNNQPSRFGVKQATLWRYLGAGKSYWELFEIMACEGEPVPEFEILPANVSPESIELLSKLSRVVPEKMLIEFFRGVLAGTLRRVELRARWESFRPLLDGRTARGRNVEAPKANLRDVRSRAAILVNSVMDTLRNGPSTWTGIKRVEKFSVFTRVRLPFSDHSRSIVEFDAVALVKPFDENAQYHGIEIRGSKVGMLREPLYDYLPFFDFFWCLLPEFDRHPFPDYIPDVAGIMKPAESALEVVRQAPKIVHKVDRRIELASNLLLNSPRR